MNDKPQVPRLDWQTLFAPKEELTAEARKTLDSYFSQFTQPPMTVDPDGKNNIGKNPCLKCGAPLAGNLVDQLFNEGGFTWGLAHGEGHCRKCKWPARAYHFIKNEDGSDFMTIRNVILQYHPDLVTEKKKHGKAEAA